MKSLTLLIALGISGCIMAAPPAKFELHNGWTVQSTADKSTTYKAKVPSTAMGVLMESGALPSDLLDGENYKGFDASRFDCPWIWSTRFSLPKLDKNNRVALELDGISYRADVIVNGRKVASADSIYGPFRRFSLDITPYVKEQNTLELVVAKAKGGEPNIGFVDWNPRPADESMGVYRPVWIHITDGVSISSPRISSIVDTETLDNAYIYVEATLTNTTGQPVDGTLKGRFDSGTASQKVSLNPGESKTVSIRPADSPDLHVKNPRLWWPNGMGSPEMYRMELEFIPDGSQEATDRTAVDFGIRTIKDYLTDENQRGFLVNGKPVLVRSAGWTDDLFLRNDSTRNETEARYVHDMGLNSIRFENIWGTSEHIYDMCDRLGLMALVGWSCQWEWEDYLGSPVDEFGGIISEHDQNLIAQSFEDQVTWLRNHPAIIGWFTGSDLLPRPELECRYLDILDRTDTRPYIGSAKQNKSEVSGYSGTKMAGPYEYVAPGYWYDPKAPGGAFGFNTETGIGAQLPQKESAVRMLGKNVWPIGDAWAYHCTASTTAMNNLDVLRNVIDRRYGGADSFDDFMHKADWVNFDGTRTMFEAFRARVPRATGIVQWMLNSAWPSAYWQLYDHYLVPTSAYYSLKRSNAPLQLIYDYGKRHIVAVNESGKTAGVNARMERYGLNDSRPVVATSRVSAEPYSPTHVFDVPRPDGIEFVFLTLSDDSGNIIAENFYVLGPDEDVNKWEESNWYMTPVSDHADFSALNTLAPADVVTDIKQSDDTLTVSLENRSGTVAFFNRLAAIAPDGNLYAPAWWSDNYFSLRPSEKKNVTCRLPSPADAAAATVLLDGWNAPQTTIKR